jgi:hypothetical protein
MTVDRCPECGGPMPAPERTGRPRVYCSRRCRSRHGHAAERQRRPPPGPVEWTADELARYEAGLMASFTDPLAGFG